MKFLVFSLLLVASASAAKITFLRQSPAISPLDYFKIHKYESRIINGQPAAQGQFPWQVALTVKLPGGSALCGASLISTRWVLTAAHCVDGAYGWDAKIGGITRANNNEPGSVIISSSNGFTHEDYSSYFLIYDIALVELSEEVELSDTIQPIRLPRQADADNDLLGDSVTASGFGKTSDVGGASDTLNSVELRPISNDECADVYGSSTVVASTLCTKGNPDGSTCNGDSGGPLVRKEEDGIFTLVGSVSFGHIEGCTRGYPTGFARISKFLNWINEKTGIPIRP